MAKQPTRPLKVTAHLLDGRLNSADGIVMFDAILYHGWFTKHKPEVLEGLGSAKYDGHVGLPLKQLPGNRWAASKAIYTETAKTVEHLNKRPDFFNPEKMKHLDMDKGIISDSVGIYRAYRVPGVIRTIKNGLLTFYCVGHADKIMEMLGAMYAVGKKAAVGYGLIDRWDVAECEDDYSLFHPEHGLMRPVEVGEESGVDLSKYPVMKYGVKPPYWKRENARLCYVPVAKA